MHFMRNAFCNTGLRRRLRGNRPGRVNVQAASDEHVVRTAGVRTQRAVANMLLTSLVVWTGVLNMQCRGTLQRAEVGGPYDENVRQQLRRVEPYVVGVGGTFIYRMEDFETQTTRDTTVESYGAGLLIYLRSGRAAVLTVRHLVVSEETLWTYRRPPGGADASFPIRRSIMTSTKYSIDDRSTLLRAAEVLCTDVRTDLAVLLFETSLGAPDDFPYGVLYGRRLDWGEMVYLFGFPRQSKQLTFGVVSPSPYPGNFVVDATTRFGYSGGPIFLLDENGTLQLVGIVRAMAAEGLDYLAPPHRVPPGEILHEDELRQVRSARKQLIEYGTTFGIEAERIGQFLRQCREQLTRHGIVLNPRFLP